MQIKIVPQLNGEYYKAYKKVWWGWEVIPRGTGLTREKCLRAAEDAIKNPLKTTYHQI